MENANRYHANATEVTRQDKPTFRDLAKGLIEVLLAIDTRLAELSMFEEERNNLVKTDMSDRRMKLEK